MKSNIKSLICFGFLYLVVLGNGLWGYTTSDTNSVDRENLNWLKRVIFSFDTVDFTEINDFEELSVQNMVFEDNGLFFIINFDNDTGSYVLDCYSANTVLDDETLGNIEKNSQNISRYLDNQVKKSLLLNKYSKNQHLVSDGFKQKSAKKKNNDNTGGGLLGG